MDELTDLEHAVLQLADRHYARAGAREHAAGVELGVTPTRYYQLLNQLLDRPAATVAYPVLVKRLRRLREARAGRRRALRAG